MTIEERAEEKYVRYSTNGVKHYLIGHADYIKGATEQDPISRAEQKKIDIEKALDWISKHLNRVDGWSVIEANFKQAMEE